MSRQLMVAVLRWGIFSVGVGLTPIAAAYLDGVTTGRAVTAIHFVGEGQLLLAAAVLVATAVGELVPGRATSWGPAEVISAGLCIMILLLSSLWYASVVASIAAGEEIQRQVVATGSIRLLVVSVIASTCCIALSKVT